MILIDKLIIGICNTSFFNKSLVAFTKSKFSKKFIKAYSNFYNINEEEILPGQDFQNLRDFFIRKIDLKKRPMGTAKYISPCDGYIVEAGKIHEGVSFRVKGKRVSVKELIQKDEKLGSYQVIYLSPRDYHRFHAIDSNEFISSSKIGDKSIPVNEMGYRMANPFLKNYRLILETKDYYYIPVGATNVNTIEITKNVFEKGDELGYFSFGSTIVILYKNDPGILRTGPIKLGENLIEI